MKPLRLLSYPSLALVIWVILCCSSVATADTWQQINTMDPDRLNRRIEQLQVQYNRDEINFVNLKELGIAYHLKAVQASKPYAPKAVEVLTRAREMNSKDLEVLCLLGSATTMLARTTFNPIKKMNYVNTGTGYMDKAVNLAPDNIAIRMTRGTNAMHLPAFLNRREIAVTDFEYLAGVIEKEPQRTFSIRNDVFGNLVRLYEEDGDTAKAEFYQKKLQQK